MIYPRDTGSNSIFGGSNEITIRLSNCLIEISGKLAPRRSNIGAAVLQCCSAAVIELGQYKFSLNSV